MTKKFKFLFGKDEKQDIIKESMMSVGFSMFAPKPKTIGPLIGMGVYGISYLLAPALFQQAANAITTALSGFIAPSIGIYLGYLVPIVAVLLASTLLTMGLYAMFAPEPVSKKAYKAGSKLIRNSVSKMIPGGHDALETMEEIAKAGMHFVK